MEILGWIANMLFFSGGLFKNPRKTIASYMIADIFYVILYLSMNLYMGAIAMIINTIRSALALVLNEKNNITATIILTVISAIIILFAAKSSIDLLIVLATVCIGISCYYRDHFYLYRLFTSISQILWIVHSIVFEVHSMLFCASMILAINIGAVIYYSGIVTPLLFKLRLANTPVG